MIGSTLHALRKQRGISQDELAAVLNVSQQAVSKWETDAVEPDIRALCALADYYGVTVDYLVGRTVHQDLTVQMKDILKRLTPDQVALLCAIAMKALKNGGGE